MISQVSKSMNVRRTNSLRQFNAANIVALDTTAGRIPIVCYIKERNGGGRRGIIFGGDSYQDICFTYPEKEHEEWCSAKYALKYDAVEENINPDIQETSWRRNHGILDLHMDYLREWYNGELIYLAEHHLPRANKTYGYDTSSTEPEETGQEPVKMPVPKPVRKIINQTKITAGCSTCGKR